MAGFCVLINFQFHYLHLSRGTSRNWSVLAFRFASLPSPPIPATAQALTLCAIPRVQMKIRLTIIILGISLLTNGILFYLYWTSRTDTTPIFDPFEINYSVTENS